MDYEKEFEDLQLETKYGKIHYKRHRGKSSTIILIHGLASSARTWSRLVQYLPGDLNLYLIDLLGHGESDAPEIKYVVNMQVEILGSLIKEQNLNDIYLFGHSYGGWISALYAKDHALRGMVLEDSAGLEEFYNEVIGTETREKYKEEVLGKAVALGGRRHVIEAILDDEFIEGQLEKKDLEAIKIPTLIVWGAEDSVIDVKYARIFQEEIRGSRLSVIEGTRHTPHYSNPEEVSHLLLEFIGNHGAV